MRKQLLVTSAVLALAAGTGLAMAQGTQSTPGATSEQPKQTPGATQQKGTEGQAQPKSGESQVQQQPKSGEGQAQQKGSTQEKGAAPTNQTQDKSGAQKNQAQDKGATQDKGKAAQKSDSGASASLSTEQRTRVREVIVKQGNAPRVTSVNFSLNVGTVVPRTVRVVALPAPVIEIYPAWRGFLYFLVNDQIVVVEPGSLRIVAVISA